MADAPDYWATFPPERDPRTWAEIARQTHNERTPEIDKWIEDHQK